MNSPTPASLQLIPQYQARSSWWEHVPIAHWLIEILQPQVVVELGTHYGVSFFAFCEAAKVLSPKSFIYAVDTWEGDPQAGFYGDHVYSKVSSHQHKHHPQQSRLIRSTFDAAACHFADKSIDVIHVDGLHTYEAVKHDFDTWLPKLKEGGTLIFHDWNVRERDFGVWKLWQEIKSSEDFQCFEIPNGHGLALATLSRTKTEWQSELELCLPSLTAKGALLSQLDKLREQVCALEGDLRTAQQHAVNLETMRKAEDEFNAELNAHISRLQAECEDKDRIIAYLRINKLKRIFDKLFK